MLRRHTHYRQEGNIGQEANYIADDYGKCKANVASSQSLWITPANALCSALGFTQQIGATCVGRLPSGAREPVK